MVTYRFCRAARHQVAPLIRRNIAIEKKNSFFQLDISHLIVTIAENFGQLKIHVNWPLTMTVAVCLNVRVASCNFATGKIVVITQPEQEKEKNINSSSTTLT